MVGSSPAPMPDSSSISGSTVGVLRICGDDSNRIEQPFHLSRAPPPRYAGAQNTYDGGIHGIGDSGGKEIAFQGISRQDLHILHGVVGNVLITTFGFQHGLAKLLPVLLRGKGKSSLINPSLDRTMQRKTLPSSPKLLCFCKSCASLS